MKPFLLVLVVFSLAIGFTVMGTKAFLAASKSAPIKETPFSAESTPRPAHVNHPVKKFRPRVVERVKIIERVKIVEAPRTEIVVHVIHENRTSTAAYMPRDNRPRPNPVDVVNQLRGGNHGMDYRF
jgi:hypothetical protein